MARMKPGRRYAAYKLAEMLNCTAVALRPALAELVESGKIERGKAPGIKNTAFWIAGTEPIGFGSVELKNDGSVALPRKHFVMTGELTGYVEPINRHRELCMLARPR